MKYIKLYWKIICGVFILFMFIEPAICILILGLLFLFISIGAIVFIRKMKICGIDSNGILCTYDFENDESPSPIIEFRTLKDEIIREKPYVYGSASFSGILLNNNIKKTVPILYDPENPKRFVIKHSIYFNFFWIIIFSLLGMFLMVLSVLEFIKLID
ncbi:MAG: hypothetical protein V4622_02110, partial [Bacteroidota bacterium]